MEADANPGADAAASGPSPDDLAALSAYATALADGIEAALAPWVERSVERVHVDRLARRPPIEVREAATRAGAEARATVGPRVRTLLALDIDEQRTGPLAMVREAVVYPTRVLQEAGVAPVERDEFAARQFPDDLYDLAPATFADLDPDLHETGLVWGAAKAHVHLSRRRAEGRR
ncbi:MAG TPA: hypothetical protein VIY72_14210 [Acidimicrobiales bacterium]